MVPLLILCSRKHFEDCDILKTILLCFQKYSNVVYLFIGYFFYRFIVTDN